MKEKYNIAYDKLYDMYPDGYFIQRFSRFEPLYGLKEFSLELREFFIRQEAIVESLRREIYLFELEQKFPFRSDAKYFLITNFNNMIIKPILFQILDNDKEISEDMLREFVIADIKTIMRNSIKIKKEDKVSGHEIMISIDSLWPELQSTRMELWG